MTSQHEAPNWFRGAVIVAKIVLQSSDRRIGRVAPALRSLRRRNGEVAVFAEAQFEGYWSITEQPREDRGCGVHRLNAVWLKRGT
jgi:hypothetical protein